MKNKGKGFVSEKVSRGIFFLQALILLSLLHLPQLGFTQDYSSRGKEFWMGFCKNYGGSGTLTIYVSSKKATSGTVSIPMGGFSQGFTVAANSTTAITLPTAQGMATGPDFIEGKGVHIVSVDTISVFALNYQAYTSDASVVLPVQTIGEEYYATVYKDATWYSGPTEVLIVGANANTLIEITPSATTQSGKPAGVPYTITLNPGQVYQLMSDNDLSGTHLKSLPNGGNCGKFAVFGGNECTNVGSCQYCDHLYDQMFPVNTWGKNYITVPLKTRNGDLFRIVASQNGTSFTVDGGGATTLNQGQFVQINLNSASYIKSNKPISLAQYSKGSVCDGANADPFYIMMSPTEQMLNYTTFNAFTSSIITQYYLNIVTKTSGVSILKLDGGNISGQFSIVPSNPVFSYARVNITQGNHTMVSDSGFFAYVYGYGSYESYGYSAGVNLNNLFAKFLYSTTSKPACPNTPVTFTGVGDSSILSWEWDFGDGKKTTGANPTHVYSDFGNYDITLIIQRANSCKKDTLKDKLSMWGPKAFIHGPDTSCFNTNVLLTATGDTSVKSFLWSTGATTSSIVVMPNTTTTYWVQGVGVCKGRPDSLTVHISKPVSDFSMSSECEGKSVSFKSLATTNMSVISKWKWDFGDGKSSTQVNPVHVYSSPGVYNVKHVIGNKNGCLDSVTKQLQIYALPKANFSAGNECLNKQISFVDLSTSSVGSISNWKWNFGDGNISTQSSPGYQYNISATYNVSLLVVSGFGCRDSITKQVIAYPIPSAAYTSTSVCLNSGSAFNSTSTVGVGSISSLHWDFDDISSGINNSSSIVSPSHLYANCGSYQVSLLVISSNACRDSVVKPYTVNCLPVAAFGVPDVCYNQASVYSDSSSIPIGNIGSWSWTFGDGGSSLLSNPSHSFLSCGTYLSRLIVSSIAGCKDTAYRSIHVFCKPIASFTVADACSNLQPVQFVNTSTLSSGNITSLNWDLGDGNTSQANAISHTYLSENNFTASLITTTDKGCSDTATKLVHIYPTPKAAFSISGNCIKNNINFADLSIISGGGIANWNWNFGDGGNASVKNPSHNFALAKTYTISMEVISGNGCKDTAYQTLNVSTLPVPLFSSNTVCFKGQTQFTNLSSIPNGNIASYAWDFSDNGNTSNIKSPLYTYSKDGSFNAKLIALSSNGCKDSISKSVVVYPLPVSGFTAPSVCLNAKTIFTDTSFIKSGYSLTSWKWDFGDGYFATQKNNSHVYASCGNFQAMLTSISNKGCRDSIKQQLIVHCLPQAKYSVKDVCNGFASAFTDLSSNTDGNIVKHNWKFGDGNISTGLNPTNTYTNCGIYQTSLIVSTNFSCVDTFIQSTEVHCIPKPDFLAAGVCLNLASSFSNLSSVVSDTIKTYSYSFGDGGLSSQKNPTHTYASCGSYNAELITESGFGCKDTLVRVVNVFCLPKPNFSFLESCLNFPVAYTDLSNIQIGLLSSWKWEFGDGSYSVIKNPSHIYQICGVYPVKLILTSNSSCRDSVVKQVEAFCLPKSNFSVEDICLGNKSVFLDSTSIASGSIISRAWNFAESGSSSNQSSVLNPEHTYASCGNYAVNLLSISDHACRDSITKNAVVHCLPSADFLMNEVCLNDTNIFINNSNVNSAVISKNRWTFGEFSSGKADTSFFYHAKHAYGSCGLFQVQLISTSNFGCSDTLEKPQEVYCLPVAGISSKNVCFQLPSSFRDSSIISSGSIIAWNWDMGDGILSSVKNPIHNYSAAGNYDVKLIAYSDHQCSDTVSMPYRVYHIPLPDFSTKDACYNMPVQFNDLSSVGGGDQLSLWDWDFGNLIGKSSLQNPVYQYPVNGVYQVKLIAESNHQCVDSIEKTVEIFPLPKVSFGDTTMGCSPLEVSFHDYSNISKGSINGWHWDFGDGYYSNANEPIHIYKPSSHQPVKYGVKLTLTSDQGCKDEVLMPALITVNPLPEGDFILDPTTTSILSPNIHFFDKTDGNGKLISWQWDFGDFSGSGEMNPQHTYQESGIYRIQLLVMNQYSCMDTIYKYVDIKPDFSFFIPNAFTPDDDGLNDVFTGSGIGISVYWIDIFDRWGNRIFSSDSMEKAWDGRVLGGKNVAQQDVYVYVVKLTDIFGEVHKYVGHVSLVR